MREYSRDPEVETHRRLKELSTTLPPASRCSLFASSFTASGPSQVIYGTGNTDGFLNLASAIGPDAVNAQPNSEKREAGGSVAISCSPC